MTTMAEKRTELYELPPVRVYAATSIAMLDYPYQLGRVDENSPTAARKSEHFIIDSGIGNDDITTSDIIEKANYLEADAIVPKDVIGDPHLSAQNTEEMIASWHELDNQDTTLIVPVQRGPGVDYKKSLEMLPDFGDFDVWYAVGGIKDASVRAQVQSAIDLREILGPDEHIHIFGCGAAMGWVRTIYHCPWLLDSLDLSTPAQLSSRGMLLHGEMEKKAIDLPRGPKTTAMNTQLCEFSFMLLNWYLSGLPREEDLSYEFEDDGLEQIVTHHQCKWSKITPEQ